MAFLALPVIFLIKRQIVKGKQMRAISELIEFFEISNDNTNITFKDTEMWSTGLMEFNNVQFFSMTSIDDYLLRIKLPTLYHKKVLTISKSLVTLVGRDINRQQIIIEIKHCQKKVMIPWNESFDDKSLRNSHE